MSGRKEEAKGAHTNPGALRKEDPSGLFGQRGSLMVRADALLVHGVGREDVEKVSTPWGLTVLG